MYPHFNLDGPMERAINNFIEVVIACVIVALIAATLFIAVRGIKRFFGNNGRLFSIGGTITAYFVQAILFAATIAAGGYIATKGIVLFLGVGRTELGASITSFQEYEWTGIIIAVVLFILLFPEGRKDGRFWYSAHLPARTKFLKAFWDGLRTPKMHKF